MITGRQIHEAKALLGWSASDLAKFAKVDMDAIARAEVYEGKPFVTVAVMVAIRRALETAGVEFTPENGGGAGVRLRKLGA